MRDELAFETIDKSFTVVIRWTNSDGSTITATFTNNKLTDKEHTL
ncbi:hypothetical protein RintRC_4448 [Richelia intracellularis]|nr:hypothetical protein RintRC_4448 [Richelia intracellularis]